MALLTEIKQLIQAFIINTAGAQNSLARASTVQQLKTLMLTSASGSDQESSAADLLSDVIDFLHSYLTANPIDAKALIEHLYAYPDSDSDSPTLRRLLFGNLNTLSCPTIDDVCSELLAIQRSTGSLVKAGQIQELSLDAIFNQMNPAQSQTTTMGTRERAGYHAHEDLEIQAALYSSYATADGLVAEAETTPSQDSVSEGDIPLGDESDGDESKYESDEDEVDAALEPVPDLPPSIPRVEFIGLNETQEEAVQEFYDEGLRGHHLRGKPWLDEWTGFSLIIKMKEQFNQPVDKIIEGIDRLLVPNQLLSIFVENTSPETNFPSFLELCKPLTKMLDVLESGCFLVSEDIEPFIQLLAEELELNEILGFLLKGLEHQIELIMIFDVLEQSIVNKEFQGLRATLNELIKQLISDDETLSNDVAARIKAITKSYPRMGILAQKLKLQHEINNHPGRVSSTPPTARPTVRPFLLSASPYAGYVCAVTAENDLYHWGEHFDSPSKLKLSFPDTIASLAPNRSGRSLQLALLKSGDIYLWDHIQNEDSDPIKHPFPFEVFGGVQSLYSREACNIAILADGSAFTWGHCCPDGQAHHWPVSITDFFPAKIKDVVFSNLGDLFLLESGEIYAHISGGFREWMKAFIVNEADHVDISKRIVKLDFKLDSKVIDIAAARHSLLFQLDDNRVCQEIILDPVPIPDELSKIRKRIHSFNGEIEQMVMSSSNGSYNRDNCMVLLKDGRIYSWGQNTHGCLGIGRKKDIIEPTLLEFDFPAQVIKIMHKSNRTFFILNNGEVFAAGRNRDNALGMPKKSYKFKEYHTPEAVDFCFPVNGITLGNLRRDLESYIKTRTQEFGATIFSGAERISAANELLDDIRSGGKNVSVMVDRLRREGTIGDGRLHGIIMLHLNVDEPNVDARPSASAADDREPTRCLTM